MGAEFISLTCVIEDAKFPDTVGVTAIKAAINTDVIVKKAIDLIEATEPEVLDWGIGEGEIWATKEDRVIGLLMDGVDSFYLNGRIANNVPIQNTPYSIYIAGDQTWGDSPYWWDGLFWFIECSEFINPLAETGILHGGPPTVEDFQSSPRDLSIVLDGGLIRAVYLDGQSISADIHDYDIETADPDELQTDARGRQFIEYGV